MFQDEIHLTAEGDKHLANAISRELIQDGTFLARHNSGVTDGKNSNVNLKYDLIQNARDKVRCNPPWLDRFINNRIEKLYSETFIEKDIPRYFVRQRITWSYHRI